jgi:hypothetical protein
MISNNLGMNMPMMMAGGRGGRGGAMLGRNTKSVKKCAKKAAPKQMNRHRENFALRN